MRADPPAVRQLKVKKITTVSRSLLNSKLEKKRDEPIFWLLSLINCRNALKDFNSRNTAHDGDSTIMLLLALLKPGFFHTKPLRIDKFHPVAVCQYLLSTVYLNISLVLVS